MKRKKNPDNRPAEMGRGPKFMGEMGKNVTARFLTVSGLFRRGWGQSSGRSPKDRKDAFAWKSFSLKKRPRFRKAREKRGKSCGERVIK